MKRLVLLGLIALAFSCSSEKKTKEVVEEKITAESSNEPVNHNNEDLEQEEAVIIFPSPETLSAVNALEEKGDSCKFFFLHQKQTYYIVKGPQGTGIHLNTDSIVLPMQYEKVYNPNMTHDGCVEIKEKGKLGLLHLASGLILKPQFEYIAPKTATDISMSYGFLNGQFYEIAFDKEFETKPTTHNIAASLSNLNLQFNKVGQSILYDPAGYIYEADAVEGNGWVFLPSYVEVLNLWKNQASRLIVEHHDFEYVFGIKESRMHVKEQSTLSKVTSFILETYEHSWDARGSTSQSASAVAINESDQTFTSLDLLRSKNASYPTNYKVRYIEDDLIEFCLELDEKGNYYDVETVYRYYQIDSMAGIESLDRPRHFDFTFFAPISEAYFSGLYGLYITKENEKYYQPPLNYQNHLSIKDLDIMRNEIYAEYGYRFKSKEWQEYFTQFDWYEPKFDNVDEQLTDLEKSNIKIILAMKEKMVGKESTYVQLKDSVYHYIP